MPVSVIPEPAAPAAESPRPSQPPADDVTPADAAPPAHADGLRAAGRRHETQNQDVAAAHQAGQVLPRQSIWKTDQKGGGLKEQQLQMLREHVVRVTETAACLPALDGNGAECEKVRAPAGMAMHLLAVEACLSRVMAGQYQNS